MFNKSGLGVQALLEVDGYNECEEWLDGSSTLTE